MKDAVEIEVKAAIWKQMLGGLFVILAFFIGAAVGVVVQMYWLKGMIVMLIPWLFGWAAYRLLKWKRWF